MCLALTALLLAAVATLAAEEDSVSVGSASLSDAWASALRTHEDGVAARVGVDAARAARDDVRADLLPWIGASGGWKASGGGASTLYTTVTASQALVDLPAWSATRAGVARVDAAVAGGEAIRTSLLHAVAQAWYATLAADAQVVAREEVLAVEEALLAGVEAQVTAGATIPLAITRQRVGVAEARAALAGARSDRALSRLALGRLAGLDLQEASLADPGPVPDPAAVGEPPPAVRAAEARVRAAEAGLGATRMARIPEVQAWGEAGASEPAAGGDASLTWEGGLQATVPLLAGGSVSAATDAARAGLVAARADLDAARRDADLDRDRALAVQQAAVQRAAAAADAEAAAREHLAGVRALLVAGRATALEVSDAGASLARSAADAIRARLDRDLATLAAWEALGLPPPGAPP
ncbi:MAG: TolC family protein [Deltaproteobacteria bacterium]|nr:TolC family protein [Deltaproteobacteria bacterium]